MICKNCNTLNSNDASICINCGEKLTKQEKVIIKKPVPRIKKAPTPDITTKYKQVDKKIPFNIEKISMVIIIAVMVSSVILINAQIIPLNLTPIKNLISKRNSNLPKNTEIEKELLEKKIEKVKKDVVKAKITTKKKGDIIRKNRRMQIYYAKKDSMKMLLIPAGEVTIGNENESVNELPVHSIFLDPFYIDEHEVTNMQFRKFVEETGYPLQKFISSPRFNAPNQPVVGVDYKDAQAYAKWAGKRLPTEFEWEKAARGGLKKLNYPFSKKITPELACYDLMPNKDKPADVKSYEKNDYQLYDMSGNVSEWTSSAPEAYPGGKMDIQYESQKYRIIRGGGWKSIKTNLTVSKRNVKGIIWKSNDIGFRCVLDY